MKIDLNHNKALNKYHITVNLAVLLLVDEAQILLPPHHQWRLHMV